MMSSTEDPGLSSAAEAALIASLGIVYYLYLSVFCFGSLVFALLFYMFIGFLSIEFVSSLR